MGSANASGDLSSEMEVDAFRRLFPLRFHEHHLLESIRPDARKLGKARDTTLALGAVASADGSALAKIGCTSFVLVQTMLTAIKMEVMTPTTESPDDGCIAIDFHMPLICSPIVRPGRPVDAAPVISKQVSDTILSSGMINFKELSLVSGKAVWMAYLVIVVVVSEKDGGKLKNKLVNKGKRKLKLSSIPFSLTCILHKKYILGDLTAEKESVMETLVTVVLDSSFQLVSLYKPSGPVLAYTSAVQDCIVLTRQRVKELRKILNEAIYDMEVD
ncbi:Exosome complex component RRP43 [Camellia lanceoleosa]|uniref:Exosome complex component RRP43 n=1 Tax=Camellia lanceoleosa TaxID=1840588 RepID=A0ACC0GAD8_9ERIC|nr:Exosome complex component RRP43 [Camellia lanceoleosa]